jgi:phage repressor protein C with HTH and peptisase S24 domain
MAPTLRSGDMLLARRGARVEPGDLVVAAFPDRPDIGLVVKRAVRPYDGGWWVESDNQFVDSDSRTYGVAVVRAKVVARYWPAPCLFRRQG